MILRFLRALRDWWFIWRMSRREFEGERVSIPLEEIRANPMFDVPPENYIRVVPYEYSEKDFYCSPPRSYSKWLEDYERIESKMHPTPPLSE